MHDSRTTRVWFIGTLSAIAATALAVTAWLVGVPAWHEYRIVRSLEKLNASAGIRVDGYSTSATNLQLDMLKGEEFQGRSATIALAKVVRDERRDKPLRVLASMILFESESDEQAAILILAEALSGADEMGRYCASEAFRAFGKTGVPSLVQALKHQNPHVRRCAADALGWIGPDAAEAIPELTEIVKSGHWLARLAAASALGKMGPQACSAIPEISDLLSDTSLHDEALNDQATAIELREELYIAFQQHAERALKRLGE